MRLPSLITSLFIASVALPGAGLCGPATAAPAGSRTAEVNVFAGTGGDGHTFPGAVVPFGMVQLSPDTQHRHFKQGYMWAAGYRYEDDSILGFSHTHFSGAGHSDLGDVLLMPTSGELKLEPGYPERPHSGYRSRFSHQDEHAEPGYYAVKLIDNQVDVELTASEHVGLHRYRFQPGATPKVVLDLRSSIYDWNGKNLWARMRLRGDRIVTGMRETRGWAPGRQLFFAIEFSRPFTQHQLMNREDGVEYRGFAAPGKTAADKAQVEGKLLEAGFEFDRANDAPLLVKVA
ncbi:MAG TPA: glycoside hydrolase family 92 protein, partial [Telluria sp.]